MPKLAPVATITLALLAPLSVVATHTPEPWHSAIDVTIEGEAGEWVFLYHELPAPVPEQKTLIHNWTFYAAAPPGESLTVLLSGLEDVDDAPPALLPRSAPGTPFWILGSLRVKELPEGAMLYVSRNMTTVYSGAVTDARAILATANAPWRLTVKLELVDGNAWTQPDRPAPPIVEPTLVLRGDGATFQKVTETTLAGPVVGYSVGKLAASVPVTSPGWTHIQLDGDNPPAPWVSLRTFNVAFPNGYRFVGPGANEGQSVNRGEPAMLRALGTMHNAQGEVTLDINRLDAAQNVRATIAHLPLDPTALPLGLERWDYLCYWPKFVYDAEWDAKHLGCEDSHGDVGYPRVSI